MTSGGSTFRDWLGRTEEVNPRSWLVGLVVALLGWQVSLQAPVYGLDPSWWSGLYMASHEKMRFGTEIVFTYGPLGILREPWLFYPGLLSLIPFLYKAALFTGFCIALVAVLRRRIGWLFAALAALLLLLLLRQIELAVAISMLVSILIIERSPDDRVMPFLAIGGGLLAGIEMLGKLSAGPVVAVVLLLGLIGAHARMRDLIAYGAALVVSMGAFWLVTGQSLGDLPDFVSNSFQIVSGYGDAMTLYDQSPVINLVFVVVVALATIVWTLEGRYEDRRADLAAGAITLVITFAFYKQAVIRSDGLHLSTFFALVALIWVAVPPRQRMLPLSLAGFAFFAITAALYANSVTPGPGFNPVANLGSFLSETRTAFDTGRQEEEIAESRDELRSRYGLGPRLRAELGERPASVEPWEVMAAWAYELDWSPAPVFQNYSAYTSELDQLNAGVISSDSGPERILRHFGRNPDYPERGIDQRLLAWDPPAQAVATFCHFRPVGASFEWQVLARTGNRCGPMVPAGSVDSSFGQSVAVPPPGPGEVVLVRIHGAGVHGLERLRSLVFRPKERRVQAGRGSYRLVPGTAGDGLMLRAGPGVPDASGRFSQVPRIRRLELTGTSGDLRFDFFRMKVRPWRSAPRAAVRLPTQ